MESRVLSSPPLRIAVLAFGWVMFGIGIITVPVPLFPSMIFLLVAMWAFSLSSPRLAEMLQKRLLAIREKALGPAHADVGDSLDKLASFYRDQGRFAEAEPLYIRSQAIWANALGEEHPKVASSLENYAALLQATNRADEAEKLEARAAAIRAKRAN